MSDDDYAVMDGKFKGLSPTFKELEQKSTVPECA